MKRFLASVRSIFRRGGDAEQRAAPRFVVAAPSRLLAGISHGGGKAIAATLNLSAAGIALAVPSLYVGSRPISKGDRLRITLDLHPLGTVELIGLVARVEGAEEGVLSGHVLAVRVAEIGHLERALYLEYIGTHGWERATAGGAEE